MSRLLVIDLAGDHQTTEDPQSSIIRELRVRWVIETDDMCTPTLFVKGRIKGREKG